MFSNLEIAQELTDIMKKEAELCDYYTAAQQNLLGSVRKRNWEELQSMIGELEPLSESIAELDGRRAELFEELKTFAGAREKDRFYQVVVRLPDFARFDLARAFRSLKIAVLRLQATSQQFEGYISNANGTIRGVMEELFPHKKGTLYSKKGHSSEPDSHPLVFSQEL